MQGQLARLSSGNWCLCQRLETFTKYFKFTCGANTQGCNRECCYSNSVHDNIKMDTSHWLVDSAQYYRKLPGTMLAFSVKVFFGTKILPVFIHIESGVVGFGGLERFQITSCPIPSPTTAGH